MNCHQNIKSSSFYFSFQFGEDSETFWLWISLMMFQMCWNVNNSTSNSSAHLSKILIKIVFEQNWFLMKRNNLTHNKMVCCDILNALPYFFSFLLSSFAFLCIFYFSFPLLFFYSFLFFSCFLCLCFFSPFTFLSFFFHFLLLSLFPFYSFILM